MTHPTPPGSHSFQAIAEAHAAERERLAVAVHGVLRRFRDNAETCEFPPDDSHLQRWSVEFVGSLQIVRDETAGEPVERLSQYLREMARTMANKRRGFRSLRGVVEIPDEELTLRRLIQNLSGDGANLENFADIEVALRTIVDKGLPPVLVEYGKPEIEKAKGRPKDMLSAEIADWLAALYLACTSRHPTMTHAPNYGPTSFNQFCDDIAAALPPNMPLPGRGVLKAATKRCETGGAAIRLR